MKVTKAKKVLAIFALVFVAVYALTAVAAYAQSSSATPLTDDEKAGLAICGGMGLVMIIAAVVGFGLYVYMIYWVYKDANEKSDNAMLWVILTVFFGLFGLIGYLVAGRKKTE